MSSFQTNALAMKNRIENPLPSPKKRPRLQGQNTHGQKYFGDRLTELAAVKNN